MFRFFRTIRKALLKSSKISKYMAYTIGEILLVVIGILLALQINNWNQERKDRINEYRVLKSIADEVNNLRWQLNRGSELFKDAVLASDRILVAMNENSWQSNQDSLRKDLKTITDRWLVGKSNITTIYDALTGSGELGLITSEELRNLLNIYKREILLLGSYEDIQVHHVDNHLQPLLNQYYNGIEISNTRQRLERDMYQLEHNEIPTSIEKSRFKSDYESLMNSKMFSNTLLQHMRHTSNLLPIYYRLIDHTSKMDSILAEVNPEWIYLR